MKLIATSNYDNETVDHILLAENVNEDFFTHRMIMAMNNHLGERGTYYLRLVEDDQPLYKWEP